MSRAIPELNRLIRGGPQLQWRPPTDGHSWPAQLNEPKSVQPGGARLRSRTDQPIGVDLFSGAGGMSLGAQWAGIDVRVAIESDPHAARTFVANHPDITVLAKRIERVRLVQLERKKNEPLIVFGGPPCQGFSTSNQRTRSSDNPSNWLFREYLRLVRSLRPEWVVFENVTGMVITEEGRFRKEILEGFRHAGYTTSDFVLNAADFGVPQKRSRLFIVASLDGIKLAAPSPRKTRLTVWDAIADLPLLENGAAIDELPYRTTAVSEYARKLRGELVRCSNHLVSLNAKSIVKRYAYIPQGGNWSDIPPRCMATYADRTRCHTGIYRRLKSKEPSVVIGNFRKNMLIHPTQDRGLSVREAARLQSFPDSFRFHGSIGFQQQQVGNAVPPLLAEAVFRQLLEAQG